MSVARPAPAAAALATLALAVFVSAAPAAATSSVASQVYANIAITAPSSATVYRSTPVATISGNANIGTQLLENNALTDVNVAIAFGPSIVDSCDNAACGATVGGTTTNTTFSYTTRALARNGPYGVTASVTGNECLVGCTPRTNSANTTFSVAVPPLAPRNVRAEVNGDHSVTVSWLANPEPDLAGYLIVRRDPGGTQRTVNPFLQGTTWTDSGTTNGGDYGYTVYAVRPGADGTARTALTSASAVADASVPVPVTVSTSVPTGGTPDTTTTVPPASSGPDLSQFLADATKAGTIATSSPKPVVHAPAPPRAVAPVSGSVSVPVPPASSPPDTYAPTLPYAATPPTGGAAAAGAPQVALRGRPARSHRNGGLLYSVAGGLLLCVLGLAVRTANRRPRPEPLEPLTLPSPTRPPRGAAAGGRSVSPPAPASAGAKAAARAAARRDTGPLHFPEGSEPRPGGVTAVADAPGWPAAEARSGPGARSSASPVVAAGAGSAGTAPAPVAGSGAGSAGTAPAPVAAGGARAEASGPPLPPRLPVVATDAVSNPAIEDSVDYFRLLRTVQGPADDEERMEAPVPAG